ncbi:MAG: hypothetical protein ABIP54_04815 [Candidatus Andersenbacteria bacterium]
MEQFPQEPETAEQQVNNIAKTLMVNLPGAQLPLPMRIIALFTLVGGFSIMGSLFVDIASPGNTQFYFIRFVVGVLAIASSYFILSKQRLALWLYACIVIIGLFTNPITVLIPAIALIYLYTKRLQFAPSFIDMYIARTRTRIQSYRNRNKNSETQL